MGSLKCVCISRERKSSAENIYESIVTPAGLPGDIHLCTNCGESRKPPVSLLPYEITAPWFEKQNLPIQYGRFGENLVAEGLQWEKLRPGTRLILKEQDEELNRRSFKTNNSSDTGPVILQVVKVGAGGPKSDAYQGFKVCAPMEPWFLFCQVEQGGRLVSGMKIEIIEN